MSSPENAIALIQERAAHDAEFRRELIADPRAALGRALGRDVPEDLDIRVVEESARTHYIVLPPADDARAELSEAELEMVAGGGGYCWNTKPICWDTKNCLFFTL